MQNTNLLIQEHYAGSVFRQSMKVDFPYCHLASLHISPEGKVFLCHRQSAVGKVGEESIDQLLINIQQIKEEILKDPSKTFNCSCQNEHTNFSFIDEGYSRHSHPIKELFIPSNLDPVFFQDLFKITQAHLQAITFVLLSPHETSKVIQMLSLIPDPLSIRFQMQGSDLASALEKLPPLKHSFCTLICKDFISPSGLNTAMTKVILEISEENVLTASKSYQKFFEQGIRPELKLCFQNQEQIAESLVHHLLTLEPKFDSFFEDLYQQMITLKWPLTKKENSLLRLKSINIGFKSKKICTIPFSEVAINADGSYRPCCWLDHYDLRDSSSKNSIAKVWNGSALQKLRQEFISGDIKTCQRPMQDFACNPSHGIGKLAGLSAICPRPMLKFHWHISGSCNLECQMCTTWMQNTDFPEMDETLDDLKKNVLPFLGEIEVVGGEPFYQKRTFALIETMKSINPLCIWNFTSNGQFPFEGKIKEALSGLRLGLFSISIDSLSPDVFSSIRKKGELAKTLHFLEDLISFRSQKEPGFSFRININFVIQKDNWTETENLIKFAREKRVGLYISPVAHTEKLFSIYYMGENQRRECAAFLKKLYADYHHPNLLNLIQNLDRLAGTLRHAEIS